MAILTSPSYKRAVDVSVAPGRSRVMMAARALTAAALLTAAASFPIYDPPLTAAPAPL
jgi:hypothetical protein